MIDVLAEGLVFQPLTFSRNRLEVTIDAADTSLTRRTDLRYALTVQVPEFAQSTQFTPLTTLLGRERPPQLVDGAMRYDGAQFRIDELLDSYLHSQKPNFGQTAIRVIPELTMPFCLRERITGGIPAQSYDLTRAKQWAFGGGLNRADFAAWGGRFFDIHLASTRQFLTWQPAEKWVSRFALHEEYLYFLLNFLPTPAAIHLRVETESVIDGYQSTWTAAQLTTPGLNQVIGVPVGVLARQIGADTSTYRVWLANENDERISEVRTYHIDDSVQQERFLLFENSLGGYDTLRLTGQGSERTTVRQAMTETDQFGATAVDYASLRVLDVEADQTLTVSTGYFADKADAWLTYLNELLLSRSIYLITPKGHVPQLLTTTELVSLDDDSDLVARQFTLKQANVEQNFSQLPTASPQPARPTAWRGVGSKLLLRPDGRRTGTGRPLKLQKYYLDDQSLFKPITEKPNLPGDPDYIAEVQIPGVAAGSTPFPSAAISRLGTYLRSNCPTGQTGEAALIVIPAGAFGGEGADDADTLAEAEYIRLDTQAYANQYGACNANPYDYAATVGGVNWRFRTNAPGRIAIVNEPAQLSNAWFYPGGGNLFPITANDRDAPVTGSPGGWMISLTTNVPGVSIVRVYRNGTLISTRQMAWNAGPYRLLDSGTALVTAGDRLFIEETAVADRSNP